MTYQLHDYQQKLLQQLSRGFRAGEMMVISAGRQSGKSTLNQFFQNNLCKEIILPMKPEPKYKFSRDWYVAEFDWVRQAEVLEWCKQQFGPHPENPDAWSRWYNKYSEKIHFRDEKDYAWFILRWS